MSETSVLKASIREQFGKKRTSALRAQGKLPAVVYGHKQETMSIVIDGHEFTEALHHSQRIFGIDIEGKSEKLLVKDLQYDHFGQTIIHVDFVRVNLSETVTVEVPLEIKGTAAGTSHGGIIDELATSIEVECVVTSIPDVIVVLVKDVEVGESIHAGDIELPDGVKLITDPSTVILNCHLPSAAKSAEDEEQEDELSSPEVITEKKDENQEQD